MGHLRVGAAVSRPDRGAVRVPVVRTGGGLAKRLGRMLLWLLVVVLLLRGLASVLSPREPAAVVRVARSAPVVWPDDAARAFAADFARAYLSYSPKDPEASARALQGFVAPELAGSIAPQFGEHAARQAVGAVTVASTVSLDSRHALVTVAAATSAGGTRYLTVPVARDARGGLVVSDLPSFAAGPARAAVEPAETEAIPASERAAIGDVTTRFLRAYLGGDAGGLSYLVPPGVRIGALAQRMELVDVDSLALAAPAAGRERTVLVSARVRDESGAVYRVGYRLLLIRQERWSVEAVNATRKGG